MNKYTGPKDRHFTIVSDAILEMCDNAKKIIHYRQNRKRI